MGAVPNPVEIHEKSVVRYEVVCDECGLLGEYADNVEAWERGRQHRDTAHRQGVRIP